MTAREKKLRWLFRDSLNGQAMTESKFVELMNKFCENEKKKFLLSEFELELEAIKHYNEDDVTTRHWVGIAPYKWVWKKCYYFYKKK